MDTESVLKEVLCLEAAKTEVQIATGVEPNTLIVGKQLVLAMEKAGLVPEKKCNSLFKKIMFCWGVAAGLEVWSHIPDDP